MTAEQTVHTWGFTWGLSTTQAVPAAIYDGPVEKVAESVMAAIASCGHQVEAGERVSTLDGAVRSQTFEVVVDGRRMWHSFTQPSAQWNHEREHIVSEADPTPCNAPDCTRKPGHMGPHRAS